RHPSSTVPQAEATDERVRVVHESSSGWQRLELRGVPAADHDLVRLERGAETRDHVQHVLAPVLLPVALEPSDADIVLECCALLVRQVAELHRLEDAVDDERRSQTRPQDLHVRPADVDDQDLHGAPPTGACQPPTSVVSASASAGPHAPGAYSRTGVESSRIGWTTRHAASTPSSRAKSIASPAIAST